MAAPPSKEHRLATRLVAGAIGGIAGTVAMTAAMRRLHAKLPPGERYPLPPREITERVWPDLSGEAAKDLSVLAHTGFGAAAGAVMAAVQPAGALSGSGWGLLVWAVSYFGWVPGAAILRPADAHPPRRNALMILAHLIWGTVAALSAKEMLAARETMLAAGPLRDAE